MTAIRIQTKLTKPVLRLPQLKALVGKKVVIQVLVREVTPARRDRNSRNPRGKPGWFARNFGGGWPDDPDDGFEETVTRWRRADKARELPR